MKTRLLIICMAISFMACAQTTEIIKGDEVIWTVNSKSDAVVTYKNGDEEFSINNQGAPNTLDKIMDVLLFRTAVKANDD